MGAPVLVLARGRSRVLPSGWRLGPDYRDYRRQVEQATHYTDLLSVLEQAVENPNMYASASTDFAPVADYARQFLNTTRVYLQQPPTTTEWHLGQRALRIMEMLLADTRRQRGRPRSVVSSEWFGAIETSFQLWTTVVMPLWHAAGDDRSRLAVAIEQATKDQWQWSAAHRRALRAMLRRKTLRPSRLIEQLTAWVVGLSVAQVRHAHRATTADLVHE